LILAILWSIGIFIGCSLPGKDIPAVSVFDHFDKLVHFIFFLVFSLLWLSYMGASRFNIYLMIALSFGYGFFLEFYQITFVEGRFWDLWDGVADGVGGILGSFLTMRFGQLFRT